MHIQSFPLQAIYMRKYALKLGEEIYSFCLTAEKLSIGNVAVAQL